MKLFICNVCQAEFKTENGLKNHKHRWFCEICGSKLKTENGYRKHIHIHEERERKILQARENRDKESIIHQNELLDKVNELKESGLFTIKFNPGDKVFLSTYLVTKPTHEKRWNRIVRVRYEEERKYYADKFTVTGALDPEGLHTIKSCIDNKRQYPVTYTTSKGVLFKSEHVFPDLESADKDANECMRKYNDYCDTASQCR